MGQYTGGGSANIAFDAALKEFYLPRLRSTINQNRVLLTALERDAGRTDISGRRAVVPINIRGSYAIGARADGTNGPALPTGSNQTIISSQISYALLYGAIRISHPVMRASKNDAGAFVRALSAEMDGMERDIKNQLNRMFAYGDGSGCIGYITDAASATTHTLDVGHKVKTGMVIDTYTAKSGGSQEANSLAATVSGNTLTTTTFSGSANSFVFMEDSRGNEPMGLLGLIDDSLKSSGIGSFLDTFQGITLDTYPEFNSQVLEHDTPGTARPISEDLLDTIILQMREQGECSENLLGLCSTTQFRKIGQLMTADRRYGTEMELKGGFKALSWAGVPFIWERDIHVDTNGNDMIFVMDMDELSIYQLDDWDWMDDDGAILSRVSGYASFDANLFWYGNLGTTARDNHGVIRDLAR
jgi:hypothetical protein